MGGWWDLQQQTTSLCSGCKIHELHGVSNRRQSRTDHHTRPLPSSLAGWALRSLSLSLSLSPTRSRCPVRDC